MDACGPKVALTIGCGVYPFEISISKNIDIVCKLLVVLFVNEMGDALGPQHVGQQIAECRHHDFYSHE